MTRKKEIDEALLSFEEEQSVSGRGSLGAILILTRKFKGDKLPINPDSYRTEEKGQVKGLGGPALSKILKDHGVEERVASEGGRTSRGIMVKMERYCEVINGLAPSSEEFDYIEAWWVERIRSYLSAKPYTLAIDSGSSLKKAIEHLIGLAEARQKKSQGTMYVGALYQHLVAAKLMIALNDESIPVYGFSVADAPSSRVADFSVGDSAIHVTTAPSEALIGKCKDNISCGLKPIIITGKDGAVAAEVLSKNAGIRDRVEVIMIDQFLITNIHEWTRFDSSKRRGSFEQLVGKYNQIINEHESDPSMRIEL